jgi:hypothetical protein
MLSNKILGFKPMVRALFTQVSKGIAFPSKAEKRLVKYKWIRHYNSDDLAFPWENESLNGGPIKVY